MRVYGAYTRIWIHKYPENTHSGFECIHIHVSGELSHSAYMAQKISAYTNNLLMLSGQWTCQKFQSSINHVQHGHFKCFYPFSEAVRFSFSTNEFLHCSMKLLFSVMKQYLLPLLWEPHSQWILLIHQLWVKCKVGLGQGCLLHKEVKKQLQEVCMGEQRQRCHFITMVINVDLSG